MKVKALSRSEIEWNGTVDGSGSINAAPRRQQYNPDPKLHSFERAVEEKRALNAAKLDRVFAKPFIGALTLHEDAPYAVSRSRNSTARALSCAADGSVILWNLVTKEPSWINYKAHNRFVRDCVFTIDESLFLSCSDDATVKLWRANPLVQRDETNRIDDYDFRSRIFGMEAEAAKDKESGKGKKKKSDTLASALPNNTNYYDPVQTYMGTRPLTSVDAHWRDPNIFYVSNDAIELWDCNRSTPMQRLSWGIDSVLKVKANPIETNLMISTGSDRSVVIYDVRLHTPVRKMILSHRSNAVAWNPIEAFSFSLANDDHNLYTYDMRAMHGAKSVHHDHVRAVMAVDYSPTGQEIVSGSYDHTVRIYNLRDGNYGHRSRDVYHSKRMQKVFGVTFSADAQMILSASDDGDVRMWKSNSSQPTKALLPKERDALDYANKLKDRYKHVPEVRRILRHRNVPKPIHRMGIQHRIMKDSERRKSQNRKKHSAPGVEKQVFEKKKNFVREEE